MTVAPRLPRWVPVACAAAPAVFVAGFYAWPLVTLMARALEAGAVRDLLGDERLRSVVWYTLWQAAASTALTLAAGVVPAYVLARYRFPGRSIVVGLVTSMFVLPTVVVGAAFLALLPDRLDTSVVAVLLAHVVVNLAVVVRTVGAMWERLPIDLDAAARTLGASPLRAFREVTLPLLRPALVAAAAIIFLFTFTSFGIVQLLGGARRPTVEVEIARRAIQLGDISGAATLSLAQLAALAALVAWSARSQARHARALILRPSGTRVSARTRRQRTLVVATATAVVVATLAPIAALVDRSLRAGDGRSLAAWRALGRPEVRRGVSLGLDPAASLVTSLRIALAATAIAVLLGGLAALAITTSRRAGRLLDSGLMLPLATSAVTIGFGLLITFDTPPVDWRGSPAMIPIGHALVGVPFVVRAVLPVLRAVPATWRDAAATLGATPLRAWAAIDLRLAARPLAVGAGFAAAISLGEFGATTFLTRSGRETVPIAITRLLGRPGALVNAQAYALATILAAVTVAVVVVAERFQARETGASR